MPARTMSTSPAFREARSPSKAMFLTSSSTPRESAIDFAIARSIPVNSSLPFWKDVHSIGGKSAEVPRTILPFSFIASIVGPVVVISNLTASFASSFSSSFFPQPNKNKAAIAIIAILKIFFFIIPS